MHKTLIAGLLTLMSLSSAAPCLADEASKAARSIPIQYGGRAQSFESFARQLLDLVAHKERWEKRSASIAVLEAMASDAPKDICWFRVETWELVKTLGLPKREKPFYSYNELSETLPQLEVLVRKAKFKRDKEQSIPNVELKAESLDFALYEMGRLLSGESLRILPPQSGETWLSAPEDEQRAAAFGAALRSLREGDRQTFADRAREWTKKAHERTGGAFKRTIALETLYFDTRPFQAAWLLYLAAFVLFQGRKDRRLGRAGIALAAVAFLFHTLGLTLRVLILSRPPVSNMYESMVWMDWVLMASAFVYSGVRKNLTAASVASLLSAVVLIYGDLLPIDTSLDVLVPVLRSNYWLSVHVLTIVSSYGLFGLAMGYGHRQLVLGLRGKLSRAEEQRSEQSIHRLIQVGMLLLGIGTVLGGVWANESWGRFWGWDPKETWALITFLGYLVVVHLRLTNVLDGFWLAVSSILGFLFVLMTWYGVNFVLGKGLHSYGFSSGGMMWIVIYLVAESLFLAVVFFKRTTR